MACYRNDPYRITARRNDTCSNCNGPVKEGEQAFWYPKGRKLLCSGCGEPAAAEFNQAAGDEDNNRCL